MAKNAGAPRRLTLDINDVIQDRRREFAKRLKKLMTEFQVLPKLAVATLDTFLEDSQLPEANDAAAAV